MPGRQRRDGGSGPAGQNGPNSGDNSNARGDNRMCGGRDRRSTVAVAETLRRKSQFIEARVVTINRVSKVVKGWSSLQLHRSGDRRRRQRSWSASGYGKAKEVPAAIQKGVEGGSQELLPRPDDRQHHHSPRSRVCEAAAGIVMLRPASPGYRWLSPGGRCARRAGVRWYRGHPVEVAR